MTSRLIVSLILTLGCAAAAQTAPKTKSPKTVPRLQKTPKTESLNSHQSTPPSTGAPADAMSGGTATTTDPLTSPPAEPLAPSPNPPAVPMDPAPAAESRRPTIGAHAQLAIPHGAGVGLNFVTANERFSFELAGQGASLSAGDTKISIGNLGAAARYHVFDGAFFLGVAVGQQTLSGEGQDTVQGQSVTAKIDIKSTHITPQLGWMSGKADGGFFFETMLGYQNPLSSSAELTTNAPSAIQNDPEYINLDRQVRDDGKKIGEIGLPVIAFKLGYLF